MDVALTPREVLPAYVLQDSTCPRMGQCAPITTNAPKLECALMEFVLTWMEVSNVNAKKGLSLVNPNLLVTVSFTYCLIEA